MHQEIAVVAQDPFALFVAFDAQRQLAVLLQPQSDFIGDGLRLADVRACADYEMIGETCDSGEVKNADVGGLFGLGSLYGDAPAFLVLLVCTSTLDDSRFGLRQKLAPNRYRTIDVNVFLRLAALVVFSIPALVAPALMAQESAVPPAASKPAPTALEPDENDPLVVRARQVLDQVTRLVSSGALPRIRLQKAQQDVQDALDNSILKKSLYSTDLLPEQADQMIQVAQRMVLRRHQALLEMQQLVGAGVISRAEAESSGVSLDEAQRELEWAQTRAKLVEQVAASVRMEREIASLETQADSHPEWSGKVFTKYQGSGVFTPDELKDLEIAYRNRFAKPLPISANGETALHRSMGFDHRGRVDVAVTPDQPEGVWLMKYLESRRIPFFAFRAAVPHQATGAHIHVGPGSTKLALSD